MSDIGFYIDDDYEEVVEVAATASDEKAEKKFKIIKIVFCILCVLLLGELVVYKYVLPVFSNPKVTISGQVNYSAEDIAMLLLPMNSSSWLDFDVDQAVSLLCSESGIANARVEKKFPDKIFVSVVERTPVAVTFASEQGHSYPLQIDKYGVLFPVNPRAKVDSNSVPIISGLPIEYVTDGARIADKFKPLIEQISAIGSASSKYFASISEICVIPKEFGNYELALIPAQSKIRVLTDRSLNEESLKYMMVVLDVLNLLDANVSELDLRYGSVSCKTK